MPVPAPAPAVTTNQGQKFSRAQNFGVAAQAVWDWFPGRGQYAFGHRKLAARFCLNIPDDSNRDSRVFNGLRQDKRLQICKDCDGQDINWPIVGCSSSEELNQLLLSFFKFTGQNISLNGIKKFLTLKSPIYSFPFD